MSLPSALTPPAPDSRPEGTAKVLRIWGLDFDARIALTVAVCVFILLGAYQNNFGQPEYGHFFYEALIPLAIIVLVWRESPRRYGLLLGDWRIGLPVAVAGIAVMAVVIWFLGQLPDFRAYYSLLTAQRPAWRIVVDAGVDLFAWEFFFRGWLMFALGRKYGTDAIWLQMVPFALMHVWKPEIEVLSTIAGGVFFGMLAWRTRSFIWGWLLHWFMISWILLIAGGYI
jgi:membrane protease YdiL (CAAX protease family)